MRKKNEVLKRVASSFLEHIQSDTVTYATLVENGLGQEGGMNDSWIMALSVAEFNRLDGGHILFDFLENEEKQERLLAEGTPTHVIRAAVRSEFEGEGVLDLIDGFVLYVIYDEEKVGSEAVPRRLIRTVWDETWDGNAPAMQGAEMDEAMEWVSEIGPILHFRLDNPYAETEEEGGEEFFIIVYDKNEEPCFTDGDDPLELKRRLDEIAEDYGLTPEGLNDQVTVYKAVKMNVAKIVGAELVTQNPDEEDEEDIDWSDEDGEEDE